MTEYNPVADAVSATQGSTHKRRALGCALAVGAIFSLMLLPLLWRELMRYSSSDRIFALDSAPEADAAIVFGAAVYGDGRLSAVLRDRMDTAITLYETGKVRRILVSGDNRADHYDEPGAMRAYAMARGVPESAIAPDQAGLRTYDTCYRASEVFGLDDAILVTQAFHLPRAIFTCRQLGLDVVGVAADQRLYRGARWYEFRETVAALRALWDVVRREPPPLMAAGQWRDDQTAVQTGRAGTESFGV